MKTKIFLITVIGYALAIITYASSNLAFEVLKENIQKKSIFHATGKTDIDSLTDIELKNLMEAGNLNKLTALINEIDAHKKEYTYIIWSIAITM